MNDVLLVVVLERFAASRRKIIELSHLVRKCLAMGMRGDSVQVERRPGRPSLSVTRRRPPVAYSGRNPTPRTTLGEMLITNIIYFSPLTFQIYIFRDKAIEWPKYIFQLWCENVFFFIIYGIYIYCLSCKTKKCTFLCFTN